MNGFLLRAFPEYFQILDGEKKTRALRSQSQPSTEQHNTWVFARLQFFNFNFIYWFGDAKNTTHLRESVIYKQIPKEIIFFFCVENPEEIRTNRKKSTDFDCMEAHTCHAVLQK